MSSKCFTYNSFGKESFGKMEGRSAREILEFFDYKSKFMYQEGMEITVPESDRRGSMDKISFSFRNEEVVLSDLQIAYVVSLFQFTIPPVIAETIQVIGRMWSEKHIPKEATRDELLNRIKKMCGMGILRRYVYDLNGQNIVLYSSTVEMNKIIHQLLKYKTDGRPEKDILPPIEIISFAAASLIACELLKSESLVRFRFMPSFVYLEERHTFYAEFIHQRTESSYTILQPIFTKVDKKRYTEQEWFEYQKEKIKVLHQYMEYQSKKEKLVQLIVVLQDKQDFIKVSTWIVNEFPMQWLEHIYFTSEGALKSGESFNQSIIKISKISFDETNHEFKANAIISMMGKFI